MTFLFILFYCPTRTTLWWLLLPRSSYLVVFLHPRAVYLGSFLLSSFFGYTTITHFVTVTYDYFTFHIAYGLPPPHSPFPFRSTPTSTSLPPLPFWPRSPPFIQLLLSIITTIHDHRDDLFNNKNSYWRHTPPNLCLCYTQTATFFGNSCHPGTSPDSWDRHSSSRPTTTILSIQLNPDFFFSTAFLFLLFVVVFCSCLRLPLILNQPNLPYVPFFCAPRSCFIEWNR